MLDIQRITNLDNQNTYSLLIHHIFIRQLALMNFLIEAGILLRGTYSSLIFLTYPELWFLKVTKGFLDKSWLTKTYSLVFIGPRSQMHMDEDTICMVYTIHIPGIYQK